MSEKPVLSNIFEENIIMTPKQYLATLGKPQRDLFETFRKIIMEADNTVTEKVGKAMGGGDSLVYEQEDVFKYCLAITKQHYTLHSLVMYANPKLMEDIKGKLKKVKFQKGCINFKSAEDFPADVLKELMTASAACDYSAIIDHYKKKKKK
jgi:hypothetical protein